MPRPLLPRNLGGSFSDFWFFLFVPPAVGKGYWLKQFHVSRFSFAVAPSRTSRCQKILPLFSKHKVVHFNKTDARLKNNGISLDL
ncbi:rhamnogalacturonan I rhamnosyltransferase 4-like [Eucalyptus grandis]|uniref:rhamnogalacturonan I rhamnosyltransferase 4-like n=1 Tax=Eucalyptus grandis TaxID=71139 RepID=UPI00192E8038|nr:rhamnogalacturonan I rhamnosyltransferase 4-like [Eucalyptus grandis]